MTDQFDEYRRSLKEAAVLRFADMVPGAHLEYFADDLQQAIDAFKFARVQLRLAMVPELAEEDPPRTDDPEYVADRHGDFIEALRGLGTAAAFVADQIELETATEGETP